MNTLKLLTGVMLVSLNSCTTTNNSIVFSQKTTTVIAVSGPSDAYYSAMETNIKKLEANGNTAQAYQDICASFERIANTEADQWEPLYYASMGYTSLAFMEKNLNKVDEWADKAESTLARMAERSPVESEVLVIKAMLSYARISVDLMSRGMEYSMKAQKYLLEAEALNDNNPRVELLLAQSFFKAPPQFGRDLEKGCQHNNKALELLKGEAVANAGSQRYNIKPHWGKEEAENNLKYCK